MIVQRFSVVICADDCWGQGFPLVMIRSLATIDVSAAGGCGDWCRGLWTVTVSEVSVWTVSVRVSLWTVTVSVSGFQCGLSLCQCQGFQCGMSLCQCQGFQSGLSLYQCQEFHCGLLGVSLYFLHCSPLHILFQVQTSLQRAAPVWSNSQWIRYVWVCLLTSPDSVVSGKVVVLWRSRVLLHNMIEGVKMESHVLLQSIYDQL